METRKHPHAAETSAHVRHGVAGVGAVIAAAAIILLPLWAPNPQEVIAMEPTSPGSRLEAESEAAAGAVFTLPTSESGARQAERLAREHEAWVHKAHAGVNAAVEEQALPPQF